MQYGASHVGEMWSIDAIRLLCDDILFDKGINRTVAPWTQSLGKIYVSELVAVPVRLRMK